MKQQFLILLTLLSGLGINAAAPAARMIPSREAGWPQWRGLHRDALARETSLLKSWPEGGPKLLWEITSLGRGYSCPIIAQDTLFITGDVGEHLFIYAFDLTGQLRWTATNGAAWKDPYPGARAAVAYSDGKIFHLNAHGRLACLEAQSGREIWAVEVMQRFAASNITWAISECLLVDDRKVYVTPGGDKALMAALDKKTGDTVWASEPLRFTPKSGEQSAEIADRASYAAPILFELAGRRHIVNCSMTHAFGVDADTGKLLWTYPMPTTYKVLAATPALYGDAVFVTGPDGPGGVLLQIHDQKNKVTVMPRWISKLDTCHGGVVFRGDLLVGSFYRGKRGWGCLDANTGEILHHFVGLNKGAVLWADGYYYLLSEDGHLALTSISRDKFELISRFRFVERHRNDVWAHPVIHQGRLYLRYHERLACFDIRLPGAAGK